MALPIRRTTVTMNGLTVDDHNTRVRPFPSVLARWIHIALCLDEARAATPPENKRLYLELTQLWTKAERRVEVLKKTTAELQLDLLQAPDPTGDGKWQYAKSHPGNG